jgi:hypothetical protein
MRSDLFLSFIQGLSQRWFKPLPCLVLSLGGGNETARQHRRQSSKNATPQDVEGPVRQTQHTVAVPGLLARKQTSRGSPASVTRRWSSWRRRQRYCKSSARHPASWSLFNAMLENAVRICEAKVRDSLPNRRRFRSVCCDVWCAESIRFVFT